MTNISMQKYSSLYVGKQTALGTVATTFRSMRAEGAGYVLEEPLEMFDDIRGEGYSTNESPPVLTMRGATINKPDRLDFNAIWLAFQLIMGDGVKTTPGSATNARNYLWEVSPDVAMAYSLYTFLMVHDNGTTDWAHQIPDCFGESVTITAEANGVPQVTTAIRGNAATELDVVPASSGLLTPARAANKLGKITIDDTYAAMQANTGAELDIKSFTMTINSGLSYKDNQNGRTTLDADDIDRNGLMMTIGLTALCRH